MNKLVAGVKRFLREEEGTEVVEWALVAGLIIAAAAGLYVLIGTEVAAIMQALLDVLSGA
jgi:pilus assembly protein Flp/PilA